MIRADIAQRNAFAYFLQQAAVQEAGTKAERFTKKEWQAMFIGSMISAMTSLAMTPDSVQVVYQILKTTFTGLFLR